MVNRQGCHTKPYNNRNFQIDGASRYFGVWLWELLRLPALSSGLFIFVFGAKLYRSCHIRDKRVMDFELKCSHLMPGGGWTQHQIAYSLPSFRLTISNWLDFKI